MIETAMTLKAIFALAFLSPAVGQSLDDMRKRSAAAAD